MHENDGENMRKFTNRHRERRNQISLSKHRDVAAPVQIPTQNGYKSKKDLCVQ